MAAPARQSRRTTARQRSQGFPGRIEPQLATLVDSPPEGEDWLHEIKYDGYRLLARIADGKAQLLTRNGKDWSHRFPTIAEALASLPIDQSWLDGEVVALQADGSSSFAHLQQRLSAGGDEGLVYVLFDALWFDGRKLTDRSLTERRQQLAGLVSRGALAAPLRYSDALQGSGTEFFRQACEHNLEGVISKRATAAYRSGRGRDWLKSKCHRRQEFVIAGYTESHAADRPFGALLLGLFENGALRYTGRVGTGFDLKSARRLHERLRQLETGRCPFDASPPRGRGETVRWVRPELVAEIRYSNWTEDGVLRHPSFQGLREDKPASEVGPENPQQHDRATGVPPSGDPVPSRIRFSNPQRVLYPEQGLTKLDLARYYETVADALLPHLHDRPLTLVRCPQGHERHCFFQKHLTGQLPAGIEGFRGDDDEGVYPVVRSVEGLLALVQLGALELHGWGARSDRADRPDQITFDLDPGPQVPWSATVQAAGLLRVLLDGLGLQPFLKTTGGKGLHLVVPIARRHNWEDVKSFSKAVARQLVRFDPGLFSTSLGKAGRQNKIFVDYLRNGRGATAVVPYSTRARAGAPVALPLHWEELDADLHPDAFRVSDLDRIGQRLRTDPWQDFHSAARQITASMWRAVQTG